MYHKYMRKILIILLFLITYLFPSVNIMAQTPTPLMNNKLTIPGFNCGKAGVPDKDQCCKVYMPSFIDPPNLGPLNPVVDALSVIPIASFHYIVQPVINGVKELFSGRMDPCIEGIPSTNDFNSILCKCIKPNITPLPANISALNGFCQRQENQKEKISCLECANNGGVYTGIGCVYTDIKKFIQDFVFKIGLGLAGGFSLLCIIYAAFMMQSSQGNPEKLKKAQEMITSCIMGLMLIIFSVFILRLIGVNILQIKGLV